MHYLRVSAVGADGWPVWSPRELVGIDNGATTQVEVYAGRSRGGATRTTITLDVVSESGDPTAAATATCWI